MRTIYEYKFCGWSYAVFILFLLFSPIMVSADETASSRSSPLPTTDTLKDVTDTLKQSADTIKQSSDTIKQITDSLKKPSEIKGANWGAAVGFIGIPSTRIAKTARLVNGVVRVEDESNKFQPKALLETHYYFQQDKKLFWMVDKDLWAHGPFVAIQPGDNVIQAIAFGWMLGFKHGKKDGDSEWSGKYGFNIGAGAVLNPSVQVLGDGITRNQPLPPGETELRFKTTSLWGYTLLISFSWY